ncbi:Flagellar hook-associated protein FlgK [Liberibacter crescens BT-1]|uniref:Flagellar hook-associated protein 1 n=1 Tax=Liberibacter crescens (strain BT-1) TaxID=1215343 RepID=L0EVF1_LIBCB|nr:flagellar hook-associated protein FlgK [Liberibacter crescens]AGA64937.1 Flagellar hook-associated protein FlgK [Liberibacter crescens BT-1]AMC12958.1 hypothetical protein RL73_04760 [Liberibacter crescens]
MSLSAALNKAQNIFSNASTRLGILVKNIENSGNDNYVRQNPVTKTIVKGITVVAKERAENANIFHKLLESTSSDTGQRCLMEGLDYIRMLMGGNDYQNSPSVFLAKFQENLQIYSNDTSKTIVAEMVVDSAEELCKVLKNSSKAIQKLRANADEDIYLEVSRLNDFLSDLKSMNDAVKSATALGEDNSDLLDKRDSILKQISQIVGISTITRGNNDLVVYTNTGITLFETVPREVTFEQTAFYDASVEGKDVYIDGVKIVLSNHVNIQPKGKIEALLQIRNKIAPVFQNQLDEIARGLIVTFAESNPTDANLSPQVSGLFSSAHIQVPLLGNLKKGLAESIQVDSKYQEHPSFIRDGGSKGNDYTWNKEKFSQYSNLVDHYWSKMNVDIKFDSTAGIDTFTNLLRYGQNSIGWLEQCRAECDDAVTKTSAMFNHIQDSYSNITGVNLQEELNFLIQVEQSYKVSGKLIASIDEMMETLLRRI